VQVLAAVAEEAPVLLLLDDAHRADPGSLRLMAGVAGRLSGGVAMVLLGDASVRPEGGALDALLAVAGLVRMRLRPLGANDVAAMVASMVNVAEEDRRCLAARLHAETGGVPLLVHETVAALVDERLLLLDHAGEWRVSPLLEGRPLPLPATIQDRMGARLASLSPAARTLLDTAAVLGTPIDSALLEAVAGLPAGAAAAGLRELSGRRIVREEPVAARVELDHPVLGRVAYALLSPSERQALHARAAAVLAARDLTTTAERRVLPTTARVGGAARDARRPSAASPADARPARPDGARTPQRRTQRAARGVAVMMVALATLTIGAVWGARRATGAPGAASAADTRRVLVGAFENRSGRADLDRLRDIATDWVVRGLDQTGLVEIVGAPVPAAPGSVGGRPSSPIGCVPPRGPRTPARSSPAPSTSTATRSCSRPCS
jgi:hypothetical protein